MSNVSLSIGGRNYTVACAEGEEDHILGLGRMIDAKIAQMEGLSAQGETRMLLFAALLLADDLHETRAADGDSTLILDQVAERLENLAGRLETDGNSP